MKNTLLVIAACILLISAVVWALIERDRVKTLKEQNDTLLSVIDSVPDAPKERSYVDTAGLKHEVFKNITTTKDGKPIAVSQGVLDTVNKGLDVKIGQGDAFRYQQIATTMEARALKAERKADSLGRAVYYYQDRYLKLAYRPGSPIDTTDKGLFDFAYNADLRITQYWQRNKILGLRIGSNVSYTNIYSTDPRVTINGYKDLTVPQRQPNFGIRAQGVATYSFTNNQVLVGPGLQVDFKKFSLMGTWYYNQDLNRFNRLPTLTARFDFIR